MELLKENRTEDILFKATPTQKKDIQALAADYGMNVSDFIRYCISQVANQG